MPESHLGVAEAQYQQHRQPVDAPHQVAQHLDRGRVDPLRVLDHEHRGLRGDDVDEAPLDGSGGSSGSVVVAAPSASGRQLLEHLADRAERPRRGERIAEPAQHPHPGGIPVEHFGEQARLARPRVADDRDRATGLGDAVQLSPERRRFGCALDQPHGAIVSAVGLIG